MSTPEHSCCSSEANGVERRDFLKLAALGMASRCLPNLQAVAGPFETADFAKLVPPDKKLSDEWIKSLFARGERTVYAGAELEKIGMPAGGVCAGQLYLGGDGKLWHWDIFNQRIGTGADHYAKPPQPSSPLEQGFALKITGGGETQVRNLDKTGFREISFRGEYPIGFVEYRDLASPASVALEAFSPFVPLRLNDSSLPATVMRFTVTNTSSEKIVAEVAGWLENAVCLFTAQPNELERRNRVIRSPGTTFLECSASLSAPEAGNASRPDLVFEDFEKETYEGWTVTGTAFGPGPLEKAKAPKYQGDLGGEGKRVANSHNARNGEDVTQGDNHTGRLTSRDFRIERRFVTFYIGGGNNPGLTCLNLVVDGKVARTATGADENKMHRGQFDVRELEGKTARLEIVDEKRGPWGNVGVDQIVFTDTCSKAGPLEKRHDFGTMGLALLGEAADAIPSLPWGKVADEIFQEAGNPDEAKKPSGEKLVGVLKRKLVIAPGGSQTVTFVLAWYFPNDVLEGIRGSEGRRYATRFANAAAVAAEVAGNIETLASQTRLWHDTWYDSTLPYWFLDRTFANASILASSTCHWFSDGRFYGWEGVGCCPGTCTHVWHYAHAPARLFPELERSLREKVDFGIGFDPETGRIRFRAEANDHWAVDGQAGSILRTYREHQTCADDRFLRRVWPRAKKALEFLIAKDDRKDGLIDGPQHNTLDADWFGEAAWLSGLYLAALRAGEEMARETGDEAFAGTCREIFEKGRRNLDAQLFNGEYYIQRRDPAHPRSVGSYDGCEIDQVFGQSWSWQVGLGRIFPEDHTKAALGSLWRYNFTPDVGAYRAAHKPGRWYAMPGEGGLLMCTWPQGEASRVSEGYDYYFNECMNGFEYQAAWHMIAEGMVMEGLAVTRMIHDRYHASRRNPWNEVECGDHYARSMASYGVFLAACGFEHHGPQGHLGFAPRITPENFRAPFTTAEGWGSFEQRTDGGATKAGIALKHGRLRLRTLALTLPSKATAGKIRVSVNGALQAAAHTAAGQRLLITLAEDAVIETDGKIEVEIG